MLPRPGSSGRTMHAEHAAIPLLTFNFPPRSRQNLAYDPLSGAVVGLDRLSVFAAGRGAKIKITTTEAAICMKTKTAWTMCPQIDGHLLPSGTDLSDILQIVSLVDEKNTLFTAFCGYNAWLCQAASPGHTAGASAANRLAPTKGKLLCFPFPDAIFWLHCWFYPLSCAAGTTKASPCLMATGWTVGRPARIATPSGSRTAKSWRADRTRYLFYNGKWASGNFKNFDLRAEVLTRPARVPAFIFTRNFNRTARSRPASRCKSTTPTRARVMSATAARPARSMASATSTKPWRRTTSGSSCAFKCATSRCRFG